jgi:hypothetical protein
MIGGGWRAGFFLRAAREIPSRFACVGALVRDAGKGERFEAEWGVKSYRTLDALLDATSPEFVVVSTPRSITPTVLREVAARGMPILTETPPAPDVESLDEVNRLTTDGARIEVAEQYPFQPMHAARLAVARSGLLGEISQAQVSFTQGYHGVSLIRRYLGVGFAPLRVTAMKFHSPIVKGPDRAGPPNEEKIVTCPQTIAWLDYGDRLGVFDFAHDQHRSYVRSNRVLVRGERGEVNQGRVRYLADFRTPIEFELERSDAGLDENLEGYHHKGIQGGGRWWYRNEFDGARLADDELAVATCLAGMTDFARGGPSSYSLAEASHDLYLSIMIDRAAAERRTVDVEPRTWAEVN